MGEMTFTPEGRARAHQIPNRQVADLREQTHAPFYSCLIALANSGGDFSAAELEIKQNEGQWAR